ncbi:Blastoderm-specific protein 25D [Papilio machaon]|uniref:Blastoderm-specific protein 25D n=1 Tax=Papilio machaon TaxID=76193 RepID=A0A0N0PCA2_PAPMA|nr:Blastoderm-specific protein 25D [Papilio machaon]
MDCADMNHYEKQLYIVFKTFDVDNEEALEKSAVQELCDALQLEDRGATLIESLFERHPGRVTFTQFRNGLLSVLGGGDSSPLAHTATAASNLSHHSDDESSGREVAPKFVYGAKKYGRRSRPQHVSSEEAPRPRVASDSRLDGERSRERMRCKRSASAMESRVPSTVDSDVTAEALEHDRRVDREHALSLCRSLQMTGIDSRIVDGVFETVSTDEITVGDFFDRLNASLSTSIAASIDGVSTSSHNILPNSEVANRVPDEMSSEMIVEAFERSGVRRPRRLLLELGFAAATVRPSDLERALDDELQALTASPEGQPEARDFLSLALLTLLRLRLERSQQCICATVAERDKLRVDLAEANRRARLLAQDVDDNHARIEDELKASLRQVEARHNEATRAAAAEMSREREKTAATLSRLEEEIARRADVEVRLRADAATLCERVKDLEMRAITAEEKAQHSERERARLAADLKAAEEAGAVAADASRSSALQLEAALAELRLENKWLRDRNDELCAELEVAGSYVTEGNAQCTVVKTLQETLARIKGLSLSKDSTCESCRAVADMIASIEGTAANAVRADTGVQTDACAGAHNAAADEPSHSPQQADADEKAQLLAVISELESSYDQLKREYEQSEEYWAGKVEEEREACGEELRAADERLTELVARIGEYERQFARAPLPAIEERAALEQQVTALEDEFAAYRRDAEARLAARTADLAVLRRRLADLERRNAPAPNPAPAPAPASASAAVSTRSLTSDIYVITRIETSERQPYRAEHVVVAELCSVRGVRGVRGVLRVLRVVRVRCGCAACARRTGGARGAAPGRTPGRRRPARQGPVPGELSAGTPAAAALTSHRLASPRIADGWRQQQSCRLAYPKPRRSAASPRCGNQILD